MIRRGASVYGWQVAAGGAALLAGALVLLIWMLSQTVGPFGLLAEPAGEIAARVEVLGDGTEGVRARVERVGPRRLLVTISNPEPRAAGEFSVRVHLSAPASRVEGRGTALWQDPPRIERGADPARVDLVVGELGARTTVSYTLDLSDADQALVREKGEGATRHA